MGSATSALVAVIQSSRKQRKQNSFSRRQTIIICVLRFSPFSPTGLYIFSQSFRIFNLFSTKSRLQACISLTQTGESIYNNSNFQLYLSCDFDRCPHYSDSWTWARYSEDVPEYETFIEDVKTRGRQDPNRTRRLHTQTTRWRSGQRWSCDSVGRIKPQFDSWSLHFRVAAVE